MYHETECGCGHHGQESYWGSNYGNHCGCGLHHGPVGIVCDCGCGHHGFGMGYRHFISKEEIINGLESYLKQLQAEATGVEERINELKKGQS